MTNKNIPEDLQWAIKLQKQRELEQSYPEVDYESLEELTLYHGTTTKYLDKILSKGIFPRKLLQENTNGNWSKDPSNPFMVYLTSAYAPYFADVAANKNGGKPVVLEVKVDKFNLYPDEDYLEQATREDPEWQKKFRGQDMSQRTKFFVQKFMAYKDFYTESLKHMGTACYLGGINSEQITRYSILDHSKIIDFFDPTITIQNFRFLGNRYRMLSDLDTWKQPLSEEVIVKC
tara:strand:- start:71 stop:766 length:696 start_codon:yes stop_codon:yes gene_type:complete